MLRRDQLNKIDSQPTANQVGTHIVRIEGGRRGRRVYSVLLALTAGAGIKPGDAYGDVRVITEDKTRRTFTLRQLDVLNSSRDVRLTVQNVETVAGTAYATIQFAEFDRKQYLASERFSLDVLPGETVRIEVDSTSQAAVGSIKALCFWEDLDDVLGGDFSKANRTIVEWRRIPMRYNGTETIMQDFTRTGILYGMSLFNPGATNVADGEPITEVEIDTDLDGKILHRTKAENNVEQYGHGLDASTKRFDYVPDSTDNPNHGLPWGRYGRFDVKVKTANASADDVLTFVQQLVPRS